MATTFYRKSHNRKIKTKTGGTKTVSVKFSSRVKKTPKKRK